MIPHEGTSAAVTKTWRRPVGKFGWDGGLGTSWYADPKEGTVDFLMTQRAWTSPSRFLDLGLPVDRRLRRMNATRVS